MKAPAFFNRRFSFIYKKDTSKKEVKRENGKRNAIVTAGYL